MATGDYILVRGPVLVPHDVLPPCLISRTPYVLGIMVHDVHHDHRDLLGPWHNGSWAWCRLSMREKEARRKS